MAVVVYVGYSEASMVSSKHHGAGKGDLLTS
jgi:hypothetical protein